MTDPAHPALRSTPDPAVTSDSPAPMAAELRPLHRQLGWLTVNRWTLRPLRWLTALRPKPKTDPEVQIGSLEGTARGALIVTPRARTGSGAVILFHGGGLVFGRNADLLPPAMAMARATGVPVICPAYGLAPENPFPAALNDCHKAWQAVRAQATDLGIDPGRIVVGGTSAGGGLAAALAQRLHDEGGPQPAAQLLIYPKLDDRTAARRDLDSPRHSIWSNANNRFGWTSYLGQPAGGQVPPYAVPARRADLSGLPPAWIGVGTADLFLDEDRDYARRLSEAGVPVDYVEVDGALHGFDMARTALGLAFEDAQATFLRRYTA